MANEQTMSRSGQILSRCGQANARVAMHSHREAQLVVGLHGVATVEAAARAWELTPRAMLWLEGDTAHCVRTSSDHRALVLSFPPALVARGTGWVDATGFVHDLVERVGRAPDSARRDRVTSVLVDELIDVLPVDTRFQRIVGLVTNEPALRAAGIARDLGMSERSFRRWFRTTVGTSFSSWHHQRLVDRAIERLRRGESVKAVAADLGYSSPSAFGSMFKRATGSTPQRYRR